MTSEAAHKLHVEDLVTRRMGCNWSTTNRKAAMQAAKTVGKPITSDELFEEFTAQFWTNLGLA